jgi:hypothetical protein
MTEEQSKIPRDNYLFAKHVYEFMDEHISNKEMKSFMIERLAECYDAFPKKKIDDHKAYFNWLETHNEG